MRLIGYPTSLETVLLARRWTLLWNVRCLFPVSHPSKCEYQPAQQLYSALVRYHWETSEERV